MADAKSLKGGILLQTPLRAANGNVYAVAQGPLSIGAAGAHPTVARIPGGAFIEKEVPVSFVKGQHLHYLLGNQDFSTANRIAETINLTFAPDTAIALNASRIKVKIPYSFMNNPVEFVSIIDNLQLNVSTKARVVINERTGTVVFGGDVKISPVAIAHNSVTIQVGNRLNQTGTAERIVGVDSGSTVQELIQTLNLMGVGAADLIIILQEIKNAGALQADLEIM
jgi:flagellar P-ring protein precursor FlgI